jgi:hypothetical protein
VGHAGDFRLIAHPFAPFCERVWRLCNRRSGMPTLGNKCPAALCATLAKLRQGTLEIRMI